MNNRLFWRGAIRASVLMLSCAESALWRLSRRNVILASDIYCHIGHADARLAFRASLRADPVVGLIPAEDLAVYPIYVLGFFGNLRDCGVLYRRRWMRVLVTGWLYRLKSIGKCPLTWKTGPGLGSRSPFRWSCAGCM